MKIIALLAFFSAVCLSGAPEQQREPGQFPVFYVVRTPKLETLSGVWISCVTVTIAKSEGYYLNAVSSDWLVSTTTKDGAYRVDFRPWPVAPGETITKHLQFESLDQVVLVDPVEGPDGMPVLPRVSITVEFFKSGIGMSSTNIGEAKVEIRRWPANGLFKR